MPHDSLMYAAVRALRSGPIHEGAVGAGAVTARVPR